MNLSGENVKTPHNEGGQNYAIELVPQFINFFVLWLPVIWQMVSCFFAIRYIRQNPDKQKKGAGCLAIVLWVYMIDAFLSLIATGITYNTWHIK